MKIVVKDLNGEVVDTIDTTPMTLVNDVEKVKSKYPVGKFHTGLYTY